MAGHDTNDERPRTADVEFDPSLQFSKMFLSEAVLRGLTRNNFTHPSPIQARAIPLAKLGLDLLVQAKSGTGKTLVFGVLITESHNPDVMFPQSLTVVPTREIAVQIEDVLNRIGYSVPNFRAKSFIGGLEISQDRKNLQNCSAVVGTPGRINHLIKSNVLNTSQVKILVLDEADSLISGSLKPEVDQIVKMLPTKRQTVVCSATYYNNRDRELLKYLNDKFIGVTPKKEVPVLHGIRQFVQELPEVKDNIKEMMAKIAELNRILKKVPYGQCLVFANTQTKADTYCSYLGRAGWPTQVIRGGQEQRVRLKTVENLKEFRCRVLTATDVISRGIDAENVNLVINVDVPRDNSVYLHRIGRAGRFGTQAIAITLVSSSKEMERFRKILQDIGGNDMFVYRLPEEKLEEIWNFEEYGDKYAKLYASKLEQEIRDQGADRSFLETIEEVDSKTELGVKSRESVLNDSLEDPVRKVNSAVEVDSIEELSKDNPQAEVTDNEEEQEEVVERIIPLDVPEGDVDYAKDVDDMFLAAIGKVDAEDEQSANQLELASENKLQFGDNELQKVLETAENGESSSNADDMILAAMKKLELEESITQSSESQLSDESILSRVDQKFLDAMKQVELDKDLENGNVPEEDAQNTQENKDSLDKMFLEAMDKLDVDDATPDQHPLSNGENVDELFLAAMEKVDREPPESSETSDKQSSSETSELSCSTPESCYTSDSSFSSNATKKVEVGSNFTTPNSRVQEIRGALPDHQVSSSSSNNSSEIDHNSDPGIPTQQNCLHLEVNNDALFAKIMEQKELEAGQLQRPFQFSIDGCSLEVHDDPVSDRDINSRKGSVPDVVPSGITLDPSRLQHQPSVEEEEEEAATFDLNSNTCGSNHGSVFEPEEAVIPQDNRPKRIRFQQQDDINSLELHSNSVGVIPGGASQQGDQPEVDPLALPPILDTVSATEEADDASSYSSQYDSESSNSSFFDQRVWESETQNLPDEAQPEQPQPEAAEPPRKRKVSKRSKNATNRYHRSHANWTTQYWNQMTMIRDYVRFAVYARHRQNPCGN
ncbi:probable ATP-dependent RNA helicase DDX20 [Aedes albopictus]|uniref:RNA helicase n=1 Tax=Aedes albopictus TaxID=7160 RepID=A0ABM1XQN8_AEDAL|nr:probable ATP-dependent RNA helicase DDX20 [Aedes albopictus]